MAKFLNVAWDAPTEPEVQPYLEESKWSDMDNPVVRDLAKLLSSRCTTPREYAITVWNWIVENIIFVYEGPKRVMQVLWDMEANCMNRSNLQMSLLRLCKIPARMSYTKYYKPYASCCLPPSIIEALPVNSITHNSCAVYLDGKWIEADVVFDRWLVPYTWQWNGYTSMICVPPDLVNYHVGYSQSVLVDELNKAFKDMGATKKWCVENIDPYTRFMRSLWKDRLRQAMEDVMGKEVSDNWALYCAQRSAPQLRQYYPQEAPHGKWHGPRKEPDVWNPIEDAIVQPKTIEEDRTELIYGPFRTNEMVKKERKRWGVPAATAAAGS